MSNKTEKDNLMGRTLVFTLQNGKSFKYGTVIDTEKKGNETKLIFDTNNDSHLKSKENRD